MKPDASIIKPYYPKATVALAPASTVPYVRVCPAERREGGHDVEIEMSKMQSYEEMKKELVEQTIQLPSWSKCGGICELILISSTQLNQMSNGSK